ncbi:MAG: hypothetical protein AAF206_14185 [Bacteroidota bacterium]
MIIPRKHIPPKSATTQTGVCLKSSHLCLDAQLMSNWQEAVQNVYMTAYPEKGYLLLAPVSSPFFAKMHECTQHLLKDRNLRGDKGLALHELLIDHDLDDVDRPLQYEFLEKSLILKVYLS